ncbi:MAG: S-layer protein domain-containing protein [Methanothrix sp.]|nr:S-layer protein domain-containing protein [Methanothrix sp.]
MRCIRFCIIICIIILLLGSIICDAKNRSINSSMSLMDNERQSEILINVSDDDLLKLNDGYKLAVKSVDINGNKVQLELSKNGQVIDSKVIIPANEVNGSFIYSRPGTSQIIMVHFKNAFRGADRDLATADRIWQTSESDSSDILLNSTNSQIIDLETPLRLEEGYELAFRPIDINGDKVYLELIKNGQVIDSKVIIPANEANGSFIYSRPGTSQTIMVHFKNAFRGVDRDLATADRIWQTSEGNSSDILLNSTNSQIIDLETPLKLEEGYELVVRSVDIDGNKAYLELIKNGQVIDSKVIIPANEVNGSFIYSRPGTSQTIMVHFKNAFRGVDRDLATADRIWQTSEGNLSDILLNSTNSQIIDLETPLKLEEGYELVVRSVDIDGNKAILELSKDGQVIDSKVIIPANEANGSFIYSRPGTSQTIMVHFKNIFRGVDRDLATADRIWQTSESNLSDILLNSTNSQIIDLETPLKLEEGYELVVRSVDIDGNKAILELSKDGQVVDSQEIIAANVVDDTFTYSKHGTKQKIMVHFENAFRGIDHNLITVNRVLQTSEANSSKILIDDNSSLISASGKTLKLYDGYELTIISMDLDGNRAYVELSKDGSVVGSKVIIPANDVDDTYVYFEPGTSYEIMVHFENAFRGADRNLVTIDRIKQ